MSSRRSRDAMEAKHDFWSISGSFICRHHVTNREILNVSRENFSFTIKFTWMLCLAHANEFDILQEHSIDDHWNVDCERPLSGSWIGLTRFTILQNPAHPTDMCGKEKDAQGFKLHPGLMTFGHEYDRTCQTSPNEMQDSNGTQTNTRWTLRVSHSCRRS